MTELRAHIPCSPHRPARKVFGKYPITSKRITPLGLHAKVGSDYMRLIDQYCPPSIADRVDGRFFYLPFGRWPSLPWFNPHGVRKASTMHLDSRRKMLGERPWMVEAFDAIVRPRDHLYVGGVPPMPLRFTGMDKYLNEHTRVWFDGVSASTGTLLHTSLEVFHEMGKPVGAEANRKAFGDTDIPVIASASSWLRPRPAPTHWTLGNHPPRSAVWYQRGVTSNADIADIKRCVGAGLDLVVNFGPTLTAGLAGEVIEIARAA